MPAYFNLYQDIAIYEIKGTIIVHEIWYHNIDEYSRIR